MVGLIAPARLAKVCTTIFGSPVVPDVRRIHSVSKLRASIAVGGLDLRTALDEESTAAVFCFRRRPVGNDRIHAMPKR